MVIFGGAGDLTKRKLMPALCNLAEQGFAPQQFAVVIVSSAAFTTDTFRQQLAEDIRTFSSRPIDPTIHERLVERTYYVRGDFADPDVYQRLKATLEEVAAKDNVPVIISITWPWRHAFLVRLFASSVQQVWPRKKTGDGGAWSSRNRSGEICNRHVL